MKMRLRHLHRHQVAVYGVIALLETELVNLLLLEEKQAVFKRAVILVLERLPIINILHLQLVLLKFHKLEMVYF